MTAQEAFRRRVLELMEERNISRYELAERAGVRRSTIQSALEGNPSLLTVQRIASGLDVSLYEFFDSELFQETEEEF